jgi:hypothetical protein
VRLLGFAPMSNQKYSQKKRAALHAKIDKFEMPKLGSSDERFQSYLRKDEDDFIASLVEVAGEYGFPYNRAALSSLVVSIAKAGGHADAVCGSHWTRAFLERHPELREYSPCGVGADRAGQATAEVCDVTFAKLNNLLDSLVERKLLTQEQRDDPVFLAEISYNMDEIGVAYTKKHDKVFLAKQNGRTSVVLPSDATHVGFHVSVAIMTRAKGDFLDMQAVIQSGGVRCVSALLSLLLLLSLARCALRLARAQS